MDLFFVYVSFDGDFENVLAVNGFLGIRVKLLSARLFLRQPLVIAIYIDDRAVWDSYSLCLRLSTTIAR